VGVIFNREVEQALGALERTGTWMGVIVASFIALYVAVKLLQRQRLKALYRAKRISPEEVAAMLAAGQPLAILDARTELALLDDPRVLPFSHRVDSPEAAAVIAASFEGHTLVSFCTCPNEASAAVVARHLIGAGFRDVRVLAGGTVAIDALHPFALEAP
jgi:rhodanese-related sulfurtransferase